MQQYSRGSAEGFGDVENVLECDVAPCAFDGADIGPVQTGTIGQLLLREAGRGSQALQVEGEDLLRGSDGDGLASQGVETRLGIHVDSASTDFALHLWEIRRP